MSHVSHAGPVVVVVVSPPLVDAVSTLPQLQPAKAPALATHAIAVRARRVRAEPSLLVAWAFCASAFAPRLRPSRSAMPTRSTPTSVATLPSPDVSPATVQPQPPALAI